MKDGFKDSLNRIHYRALNVRITQKQMSSLEAFCAKEHITKSEFVRAAIKNLEILERS